MTNIKQAIKHAEKERAKRIKRRNKKLAKHGLVFKGWTKHQNGSATIRLKVLP